ncbi:uncharacterized protein LOC117072381 [Trachypithecus francoisi]|uniref:uncharacterized protein LOC117072381 n=1 Tax=Trachypithecus francoisi TaxID=54180 RepID=UPI00141ADFA7|nr:uncharacterized protein LOC117072381 [Trachypithecus francoisi]
MITVGKSTPSNYRLRKSLSPLSNVESAEHDSVVPAREACGRRVGGAPGDLASSVCSKGADLRRKEKPCLQSPAPFLFWFSSERARRHWKVRTAARGRGPFQSYPCTDTSPPHPPIYPR